jgi:glycosyltransferase involved in cell wall biosynthesis
VSDAELRKLYARCRAVILPGIEDFGIVPVEAIASGKPMVALGKGGVLESVPERNPRAGFFYPHPGEDYLAQALDDFEREEPRLEPQAIQAAAARFSTERFETAVRNMIFADAPAFTKPSQGAHDTRSRDTISYGRV